MNSTKIIKTKIADQIETSVRKWLQQPSQDTYLQERYPKSKSENEEIIRTSADTVRVSVWNGFAFETLEICVREKRNRLPVAPMKTNYGMKTRPHFQPTGDWRTPGGLGAQVTPPPPTPQISGPSTPTPPASTPSMPTPPSSATATPPTAPPAASASVVLDNTKPVKPVTVGEVIADELPPWA